MCLRIEERLLITLPVNVDEVRSKIAQQRLRGELIVNKDLVTPGRGEFATNDQFISRSQPGIFKNIFELGIGCNRKESFDRRALSTRLDQLTRKPATNQNPKRINNDRLPRPSLTRQQIESTLKLNLHIID